MKNNETLEDTYDIFSHQITVPLTEYTTPEGDNVYPFFKMSGSMVTDITNLSLNDKPCTFLVVSPNRTGA